MGLSCKPSMYLTYTYSQRRCVHCHLCSENRMYLSCEYEPHFCYFSPFHSIHSSRSSHPLSLLFPSLSSFPSPSSFPYPLLFPFLPPPPSSPSLLPPPSSFPPPSTYREICTSHQPACSTTLEQSAKRPRHHQT